MNKKIIFYIILIFTLAVSCSKKVEKNMIDMEQIDIDGSSNDRYIFREEIKKEKWRERRYKKNKF